MADNQKEMRRLIGIALRSPIIIILALLWGRYIWWWLALAGVSLGLLALIIIPIGFPVLKFISELGLAFLNSDAESLSGYWNEYPDKYIKFCKTSLLIGFPTLRNWLFDGFSMPTLFD
jgi:hypothetical protein